MGGAPTPEGVNLLFGIIFAENCMEMKRIGLGRAPPDPPLETDKIGCVEVFLLCRHRHQHKLPVLCRSATADFHLGSVLSYRL